MKKPRKPEVIAVFQRYTKLEAANAEVDRLNARIRSMEEANKAEVQALKLSFALSGRDRAERINDQLLEIMKFGSQEGRFPRT